MGGAIVCLVLFALFAVFILYLINGDDHEDRSL